MVGQETQDLCVETPSPASRQHPESHGRWDTQLPGVRVPGIFLGGSEAHSGARGGSASQGRAVFVRKLSAWHL
jgi:hypothetical protein